eukprot:TRINITY_DN9080_c0_g1_i1.p1 TRINITY_DN9080_c0_g1~~TRINITY_DN9080_c0_g1_i1.p1  ORF type:complete len:263 (+),score=92.82 TRINITY_DN9080_c0_g1_i1:73-789(+)
MLPASLCAPAAHPAPGLTAAEAGGARVLVAPHDVMGRAVWPGAAALCEWLSGALPGAGAAGRELRLVELGAGVAVPSLVAGSLLRAWGRPHRVLATDSDQAAVGAAAAGAAATAERLGGGEVETAALDWGDGGAVAELGKFDIVMGSDIAFDVADLPQLCSACAALLDHTGPSPRVALSLAGWFDAIEPTLEARMAERGLVAVERVRSSRAAAGGALSTRTAVLVFAPDQDAAECAVP